MDEVVQIGTALIAFYGAVFSTWLFFRQKRLDSPSLWVGYELHYPIVGRTMADRPDALVLNALNSGRREILVSQLALDIPGFMLISPRFLTSKRENRSSRHNRYELDNARLAPGDTIDVSFDYAQLLAMLSDHGIDTPLRVRGLCHDSLYNFFAGTWIEIGGEAAAADTPQTPKRVGTDSDDGYVFIKHTIR